MQAFCGHCHRAVELPTPAGPAPCPACQRAFEPDVGRVAWLEVLPPSPERSWNQVLEPTGLIVGRGRDNGVTLLTNTASRRHAHFLQRGDGRWTVADLSSSNGTRVFQRDELVGEVGQQGDAHVLEDGQRLAIGVYSLRFHEGAVPVVKHHHALLDAAAGEPAAWQVWADQLLERHDPLGLWLVDRARSEHDLTAMASALVSPNEHRSTGVWNDFGFLSSLTLTAQFLLQRDDALNVPAVTWLTHLTIRPQADDELTQCLNHLRARRLPASLRTLDLEGATPAQLAALRTDLSSRCPHLSP